MSPANPTTIVEYRPVVGFPSYKVGSDGSVWTCITKGRVKVPGSKWYRMRGHYNKQQGYILVSLRKEPKGKLHTRKIHTLVLEAFVGPCPDGMEARHFPDGSKTNNQLANLQWGTYAENSKDSIIQGRMVRGSRSPHAKLTEFDIPTIRRLAESGVSCAMIAKTYKVSGSTVVRIIRRQKWSHVA